MYEFEKMVSTVPDSANVGKETSPPCWRSGTGNKHTSGMNADKLVYIMPNKIQKEKKSPLLNVQAHACKHTSITHA